MFLSLFPGCRTPVPSGSNFFRRGRLMGRIIVNSFVASLVGPITAAGDSLMHRARNKPVILGWVERARIYPSGFPLNAKLDTGAKTSSLDAPGYQLIKKGEKDWVRSTVTNFSGLTKTFELEQVRLSVIKSRTGPKTERSVVRLDICVVGN